MKRVECCVQGQGHSGGSVFECLSVLYFCMTDIFATELGVGCAISITNN